MERDTSTILDLGLNVAIMHISSRLFPCGFKVEHDEMKAPSTFQQLKAMLDQRNGAMIVYGGGSDHTIYGDPEVNYAFRAWHDWCHYKGNHDFTPEGEAMAAEMQIKHLEAVYGADCENVKRWSGIIRAEVNGQGEYLARYGRFPEDQRGFILAYAASRDAALNNSTW